MVIIPENKHSNKGTKTGIASGYHGYDEENSSSAKKGTNATRLFRKAPDPFMVIAASVIFVVSFIAVYKLGNYLVSLF